MMMMSGRLPMRTVRWSCIHPVRRECIVALRGISYLRPQSSVQSGRRCGHAFIQEQRRYVSVFTTDTTSAEFDRHVKHTFHVLQDSLETYDSAERPIELSESDGVLKLIVADAGTYVINQHTVTRQLWCSSPISGPSKYNYHRTQPLTSSSSQQTHGRWLSERDPNNALIDLLQKELSFLINDDITFTDTF